MFFLRFPTGTLTEATCDLCGREFVQRRMVPSDGGFYLHELEQHLVDEHDAPRCEEFYTIAICDKDTVAREIKYRCERAHAHQSVCEYRIRDENGWTQVHQWSPRL